MGVKIYIIQEEYIDYLRQRKKITADIYLKMSEKELKEHIKNKEKGETLPNTYNLL